MVIKEPKGNYGFYTVLKRALSSRVGRKWIVRIALGVLLIVGTNIASMYYGVYLHKTGPSMTLTRWASSLARDKLSFIPNYISGLFANPEHLTIDIKFKNFQKLAHKRQEALERGHLVPSPGDWVPARIRYRGETYRIDMRLKGDTPDHWKRDNRWSFKIKVKDNKTLFGLRRFAIQDPRTRNYLNEWYFHKLLGYYGLIHLRYDFIDVTINGRDQPIYAVEENIDKRLIENNGYREGPIIRFTSGYQWGNTRGLLPYLLGASIDAYQQNKIMRNDVLSAQFDIDLTPSNQS